MNDNTTLNTTEDNINLNTISYKIEELKSTIAKVIVGKNDIIDFILIALLTDGHILLEGMPGVAKTKIAKTSAQLININYSRIQFTPDLMPSDVLGTNVFHPTNAIFQFNRGPIFSNLVLIDEINRAPAKTQAALFEVMEERQITMDGTTYKLEEPFMIIATQNPVEQEGTYKLPEAQLDRFLFKVKVDYPSLNEELAILKMHQNNINTPVLTPILSTDDIISLKKEVKNILIDETILDYISKITTTTRNYKDIYLGASPRASLALLYAAKAFAAIQGRSFVIPEDIVYLAPSILRHRIIITPEKEIDGFSNDDVIQDILKSIPVPRA